MMCSITVLLLNEFAFEIPTDKKSFFLLHTNLQTHKKLIVSALHKYRSEDDLSYAMINNTINCTLKKIFITKIKS